jgi:pyrroloquinoline quinone biosynthesis protein D
MIGNEGTGPDRVPLPRFDVRVRVVRGSLVVALPQQTFELSESGAFIWKLIDGDRSVQAIAKALAAEYDIPTDVAIADTVELIEFLGTSGLIEN